MALRPLAPEPYHMNNCHQWSKFHDIQEYRIRHQNNFGCNICLLGFSFIPFLHKNCRTRERYAFASCHNCGFSVCNLIIDFLPAQPGELSEICRKPKLYIPGMYTIKTLVDFCLLADWAVRAVLKMSAILIKYPNCEVFSSYFHGQNKETIWVFVHCSVHTKKLINIKVRKLTILANRSRALKSRGS